MFPFNMKFITGIQNTTSPNIITINVGYEPNIDVRCSSSDTRLLQCS